MRNGFSDGGFFQVVKGTATALLISLCLAAVFALLLRVCPLGEGTVRVVTQILKAIALAVGCFLFLKGEKGLLKGAVCGLLFSMLGYLVFSSIGGNFALSWLIFLELLVFSAVGGLIGVAAVNVKKS